MLPEQLYRNFNECWKQMREEDAAMLNCKRGSLDWKMAQKLAEINIKKMNKLAPACDHFEVVRRENNRGIIK